MNENEHKTSDQGFGEIEAGLERLRDAIDTQHYPGNAWAGPPARKNIPLRVALATAAAAAIVILAIWLLWQAPAEPIPQVSQAEETQPVAMRQEHQFQFSASLTLPTMTFDAPPPAKLGLPSLDRSLPALSAASLSAPTTWAVPTYTLPQIP